MKIRIWNAFASNNSGSYTIVGSFPSCELASEVADELAQLMQAHELWLQDYDNHKYEGDSPLKVFAKQHRLTAADNIGMDDDWPQYSDDNTPQAFAVDHQVIIHHEYTVTLPAVFGQYFYARGGRVDHELNHTHHPLVAIFKLYIPWQERKNVDVPATIASVLKDLHASDGPLVKGLWTDSHDQAVCQPAWQTGDGLGEADLTVGAVFEDLLASFTSVDKIAKARGFARVLVQVSEIFGNADPLAFLRPSSPPLEQPQGKF